jgi:hypothetical protein
MKIIILETKTQATRNVEFNGTTFEELVEAHGIPTKDVKLVIKDSEGNKFTPIKPTKLPKNDFMLFIFPEKVKSGGKKEKLAQLKAEVQELNKRLTDSEEKNKVLFNKVNEIISVINSKEDHLLTDEDHLTKAVNKVKEDEERDPMWDEANDLLNDLF